MLQLESFRAGGAAQGLSVGSCCDVYIQELINWSSSLLLTPGCRAHGMCTLNAHLCCSIQNLKDSFNIRAALRQCTHTLTLVHVFYRECLNLSTLPGLLSQGKSACAFILISSQHKEAARTLKFSGHTLILSIYTFYLPLSRRHFV